MGSLLASIGFDIGFAEPKQTQIKAKQTQFAFIIINESDREIGFVREIRGFQPPSVPNRKVRLGAERGHLPPACYRLNIRFSKIDPECAFDRRFRKFQLASRDCFRGKAQMPP
jgi:hypothetical protein